MQHFRLLMAAFCLASLVSVGCGSCDDSEIDEPDGSTDVDTSNDDTTASDTGLVDTGSVDTGPVDTGSVDSGASDTSTDDVEEDTVADDTGLSDTETGDTGPSDTGTLDTTPDTATATCGDGTVEGAEVCDDNNMSSGDYCSADCSQVTGSCGDGTLQSNETCDDGATSDCTSTHDGGDGSCVPQGQCASGYVLDANGDCVMSTTGLSTPCQNGSGWTLFRFHYDSGSTSARIDVWDASCSYSFANQACNVQEVTRGFNDFPTTSDGYPIVDSSEYIRVRFSASGLNFSEATVHIQGRSYSSISPTDALVESPLYGSKTVGPIDQDFTYDWYALDWTGYLYPSDDPNLTAIQIYADGGSSELAVQSVELCVQ